VHSLRPCIPTNGSGTHAGLGKCRLCRRPQHDRHYSPTAAHAVDIVVLRATVQKQVPASGNCRWSRREIDLLWNRGESSTVLESSTGSTSRSAKPCPRTGEGSGARGRRCPTQLGPDGASRRGQTSGRVRLFVERSTDGVSEYMTPAGRGTAPGEEENGADARDGAHKGDKQRERHG